MKKLETSHLLDALGPLAEGTHAALQAGELDQLLWSIANHGWRCVRPRPGLTTEALPFETIPVPWSTLGRFLVDNQIRPGGMLSFAAGDYAVQDAASLLPLTLMQVQPGELVADCCAAPGGKSAAILESLGGDGLLVSNEVIASRVDTLQLTLARTGASNYVITHQPVAELAGVMSEACDCVLVDAPCTGQSLVGRGKQSLSAFSVSQIEHCAARQQSIIRSAMTMVKPGGRLVYSTCTFAYAENEAIVRWMRELAPDWQVIEVPALDAWRVAEHPGCYRIWPHRDHCAGGFAAALCRPVDSNIDNLFALNDREEERSRGERSRGERSRSGARAGASWLATDDLHGVSEWGQLNAGSLFSRGHSLCWFDSRVSEPLRKIAWSGVEVASQFGDHWQPAYPLATLSPAVGSDWFKPHVACELSDQEAIVYMSGSSIHRASHCGSHRGSNCGSTDESNVAAWQVATWRGRGLGWGKQVAQQLKNHLPKPLRQPTLKIG